MKNTPLYEEIKAKMTDVIEAEENRHAWHMEAQARMKPVNVLIRAAQQMDPANKIDRKALIDFIRQDLTPATAEPQEAPEEPAEVTD